MSSIVWRTSRWSGITTGPVTFSWQAAAWGNTAAMRSSASMRWIGGGLRRPPWKRSTSRDRLRFQRQRAWNIGDGEQDRVLQHVAHRLGEVAGHLVEREAVVGPERQDDGVVGGRRLELEVERDAELLAQRQAEPPVDPAAEGECTTSCMPPVSSKKRSTTRSVPVGMTPSTARPTAR